MTRLVDGGVTAPRGFVAAGVACGIKRQRTHGLAPLDLALVSAHAPVPAAAVFTTNKAVAAPVVVSRQNLAHAGGRIKVIVVNSGCANAATGKAGLTVAREMAALAGDAVSCPPEQVLVASTGVIGVPLDLNKVRTGIAAAAAALSTAGADAATRAIMTTDPFPKSRAAAVDLPEGTLTVGGMAKGSGMIEPRMATMLGFLTTDAKVEPAVLAGALRRVVDATFNAITVDGECSTNDCVFMLASGESGISIERDDDPRLIAPMMDVAGHLAREIVRGGEGATKLVTVHVTGAASHDDAWLAVRTIANSPLVKTAIHGGDPNWGRLVAAAGRSGAAFDLDRASVSIGDVALLVEGVPHDDRAEAAAAVLTAPTVTLTVDLGTGGPHAATMWTCDFSAEYVRINAEYPDMKAVARSTSRMVSKDFLSVLDLAPAEFDQLLDRAIAMKRDRAAGRPSPPALAGKHVALLFEKPSLRTRITFVIAVRELGGEVIEPPPDVIFGGRETVEDVARNLERWVEGVVIRTYGQKRLKAFASAASRLHVINALTNEEHPCQALADIMTLQERLGSLAGRTLTYMGDGNNVAASLAHAGSMAGLQMRFASPSGFELSPRVRKACARVARHGSTITVTNDPFAAVAGADAVYTDVWASMGQEHEAASRAQVFHPFQVNRDLMRAAAPRALFMHCLPAHRGIEVTDEVMDSPASCVFDQAENRLHSQKALLALVMG